MSYGKVKDTFWTDKKIQALSDDAKMLALYLMTGPHRNILGCMRVPNGYITEDLGWASTRLADAIAILCGCGFILRDDAGWTLILNQMKHDPIKVPNHARAAIALADLVPPESSVYQPLAARLKASLDAIGMASEWEAKGIAIPEPSPLPEPLPEPEPPAAPRFEDEFPKFWEIYPKKADRGHALKAFIAARKAGADFETLVVGASRYRDDPKRNPDFTKNAQGWLTGECWNDSPAVAPPAPEPVSPEQREANRLAIYAEIIKHGRPPGLAFTGADRHKLIQRGLVTMEQCERAGCAA